MLLDLDADQLLTTTRAVRKRLDFERPVEDDVIRDCVRIAMQAPSGSNVMTMQFVVVTDAAKRAAIGEVYRRCFDIYRTLDGVYAGSIKKDTEPEQAQQDRVTDSANYLAEHMGDAPALIIGCTPVGSTERPAWWRPPSSPTSCRPCGASCSRLAPVVSERRGPRSG